MPLPDIAFESHLSIDLELVHVKLLAKQIFNRLNHAGMTRQFGERLAVQMRREIGSDRVLAFFAHIERFLTAVEARNLFNHHTGLFRTEKSGEKQIALFVKLGVLLWGKYHFNLHIGRIQNSVNYRYFLLTFCAKANAFSHNYFFLVT